MNIKSKKLDNFKIYQPGACHYARLMAYAIYLVMLDITSPVLDYLRVTDQDSGKVDFDNCNLLWACILKIY